MLGAPKKFADTKGRFVKWVREHPHTTWEPGYWVWYFDPPSVYVTPEMLTAVQEVDAWILNALLQSGAFDP